MTFLSPPGCGRLNPLCPRASTWDFTLGVLIGNTQEIVPESHRQPVGMGTRSPLGPAEATDVEYAVATLRMQPTDSGQAFGVAMMRNLYPEPTHAMQALVGQSVGAFGAHILCVIGIK